MFTRKMANNLVKDFITMEPELLKEMRARAHDSPYHLETVSEHTFMTLSSIVYSSAGTLALNTYYSLCQDENPKRFCIEEVTLAMQLMALLHDIGKPATAVRLEDKNRTIFAGHAEFGSIIARRIIRNLMDCEVLRQHENGEEVMTHATAVYLENAIVTAINLHDQFINIPPSLQDMIDALEPIARLYPLATAMMLEFVIHDKDGKFCDPSLRVVMKDEEYRTLMGLVKSSLKFILRNKPYKRLPGDNAPACIMLLGLPGSGKTTYAKHLLSKDPSFTIISRDDLLIRTYKADTYNESWEMCEKDPKGEQCMNDILFKEIRHATDANKNIIIDMTNMSIRSRNKKWSHIPARYSKKVIVMSATYEEVCERIASRPGKAIPRNVLFQMMTKFVMPGTWLENCGPFLQVEFAPNSKEWSPAEEKVEHPATATV